MNFGEPDYGLTRKLPGVSYADAIGAVKEALKEEGFGVLTEIDVKETLKKKIDVDFRPYIILGACNPKLAHGALTEEAGVGLLLPCNVVVSQDEDGTTVVSAIDPEKMFTLLKSDKLAPIAKDVRERLNRALSTLT
jgi:uncharacterized protein (DUF302 family)